MRRLAATLGVLTSLTVPLAACGSSRPTAQTPPSTTATTSSTAAPTTAAPTTAAPTTAAPTTAAPSVHFQETAPQPPPGALTTPSHDAADIFASVPVSSSVDALTQRVVAQFTSQAEPTSQTVSVEEVTKGIDYRIHIRQDSLQDDSVAARNFTIDVAAVPGGWAVTGATVFYECWRGVDTASRLCT